MPKTDLLRDVSQEATFIVDKSAEVLQLVIVPKNQLTQQIHVVRLTTAAIVPMEQNILIVTVIKDFVIARKNHLFTKLIYSSKEFSA